MKPKKRLLSLLLCVTMLFSLCPQSVSAEGSMGTACTHEHTDDCYMEVIECVHEHDENCYSEIEGSVSENDATLSNATQRESENCTHICTEESGCMIRTLNCLHEHDEDCTSSPETAAPAEGTEGDSTIQTATDSNGYYEIGTPEDDVAAVQALIDALPTVDTVTADDYDAVQDAYDAYDALTAEQQATIIGAEVFEELFAWFNGQTMSVKAVPEITYITADGTDSATAYERLDSNSSGTQSSGIYYVSSGFTLNSGLSFTGNTTLVLGDGVTLTVEGVLSCTGNLTITTVENAKNAVLMVNGGTREDGNGYGIYTASNLSIYAGTVNATGGNVTADSTNSYGIYGFYGSLIISGDSTSVTATGGTASSESYGIYQANGYTDSSISITDSTVNAFGGTATGQSTGIRIRSNPLSISGKAKVTAKGGDTAGTSRGIHCSEDLTISGNAEVTAESGRDVTNGYGIQDSKNVTINGGKVTATAGAASCWSCGINAKGLSITSGTVEATGGTASANTNANANSYGIWAEASVSITGGSVTATSSTANSGEHSAYSYGIYANSSVAISDSTVTAYSGTATASKKAYSYGICAKSFTSSVESNKIIINQTAGKTTKLYGKDSGPVSLSAYSLTYNGGELKLATDSTFTKHLLSDVRDQSFLPILPTGYTFVWIPDENPVVKLEPVAGTIGLGIITLSVCDHTDNYGSSARENGICKFCGGAGALVKNSTSGTEYESFSLAYNAAKNGETIALLSNVTDEMTINDSSKKITLDLNGKTVSSLTVSVPAAITDSTGGGTITLTTSNGVKVIDLLEAGYAFKDETGAWYDSTHNKNATGVTNAAVKPVPITGVSIATTDNTTLAYGYTDAPTFTATPTGTANGASVTYKWYVDGGEQTGETGSTVSFPSGKSVTTYKVKCDADVDGYVVTSDEITVTVNKATLTTDQYTAPTGNTGLTYNGTEQQLLSAAGTHPTGTQFLYSLDNANWKTDFSAIKGKDAKDYTVYWELNGANYEKITDSFTVTIGKATPTAADFTFTAPTGLTYDGNVKAATVTSSENGMGAVTVKYFKDNTEVTEAKDAGIYTVKISVAEDANYKATTNDLTADSWKFTIAKGTQTITTPTGQTIARGRSNVDISSWASAPGTLTYTLIGMNPDGVTLENNKLTVPSSVAVGAAISIKVTAAATDNYNEASNQFTVTVEDKADAGVTIESAPTSKTYGDSFTLTAAVADGVTGGTWSWTTSDSSIIEITGGADSATVTVKAKKADTTGATLTATYTSDTHYGTADATIPVTKRSVTISGITAQNKTYDGTDEAWLDTNSMVFNGKLDGDGLDINVEGTFDNANAGENKTVDLSYELYGGSKDNYELDTTHSQTTATASIGKATPTVTTTPTAAVTYGKTVDNGDIQGAMSVGGEFAWKNVISYGDATNGTPKTLTATFTPTDTTNYNSVGVNVSVTVNKATYGDKTANGSAKYGGSNSVDLSGLIMPGGTATASIKTDTDKVLNGTPTMDGNKLQFTLANDAALVGKTADIEVSVSGCTNYTDYKITVTLTVDDKLTPTVTAPTAIENLTYNGTMQTLITAGSTNGGTLQYSLDNSTWSAALPKAKDADNYTVYYKVVGNADYADTAVNSIPVTIGKKAVTVKPKSYTITKGSTIPTFALEYVGLVDGDTLSITVTPAFTCYEADGTTAVSTSTAAGSYTITWTNSDAFDFTNETNYTVTKATTGTLTINAKPNSNNGNGGNGTSGNQNNGTGSGTSGNQNSGIGSGTFGRVQRIESPKTGDNTRMGLWLFTLCASAGAMTVLLFLKRREEEHIMTISTDTKE